MQIDIPAQNLTSALAEVKGRHVWGTDIYTDDSNLICALMHCGYYNAALKKPVAAVAEMNVVIQLMPPQQTYPNYTRNGIRPRAWWVGGTTCSYKVQLRSVQFFAFGVVTCIGEGNCIGNPGRYCSTHDVQCRTFASSGTRHTGLTCLRIWPIA